VRYPGFQAELMFLTLQLRKLESIEGTKGLCKTQSRDYS
jgi:hypothetical protein